MVWRGPPAVLGALVLAAGLALPGLAVSGAALKYASAAFHPATAPAERADATGHVEQRAFFSAALDRTMPYSLYLPPGYSGPAAAQRYPVLYLLHGRGDSHLSWTDYGVRTEADRLIAAGTIAPLLIVMPEGEAGFWVDHAAGGPRWGTYISRDLVDEIDASLPTIRDRSARAIGGNSMGAYGALQLALLHPETFSVVGAHSVALRTEDIAPAFFGEGADFRARDPVSLYASRTEAAQSLQLWLDIGADDPWLPAAARFDAQLTHSAVAHQWTVWTGGHDGDYWREHMAEYLTYYGRALQEPDAPNAGAVQPSIPPA